MVTLPLLYGVRDAEEWIRAQLDQYRGTSDDAAREQLLMRVLQVLSAEANLRPLCRDLSAGRDYLEYAYRCNLGFYVVYLADPEIGIQCRLHLWMPGAQPIMEKPHRHRMGFASKVLSGGLRSLHYQRIQIESGEPLPELGEGDELYHETLVNAPAVGSFNVDSTEHQVRGDVVLRLIADLRYSTGESYFFRADGIHRVSARESRTEPSITLTVWEPPFQPSLAYEPVGSLGGAPSVRHDVMRVSEAGYLKLFEALHRVLEQSSVGIRIG